MGHSGANFPGLPPRLPARAGWGLAGLGRLPAVAGRHGELAGRTRRRGVERPGSGVRRGFRRPGCRRRTPESSDARPGSPWRLVLTPRSRVRPRPRVDSPARDGSKRAAKRAATRRSPPFFSGILPAGLLDAGQFASVRHLAEAYTGDTELLERSTRTAIDGVAVANAYR